MNQLGAYYSNEDSQYKMLSSEEILDQYSILFNDIIIQNWSIESFPIQECLSNNTGITSSLLHFLLERIRDLKATPSTNDQIKLDHIKIAQLSLQLVFQSKKVKVRTPPLKTLNT
jgi:hypothetical protein